MAEELRSTWVSQMQQVLSKLPCPVALLWMADAAPPAPVRRCDLKREPWFVDTEMIAAIRPAADAFVQVIAPGQKAASLATGLPDQPHHDKTAEALAPVLRRLLH